MRIMVVNRLSTAAPFINGAAEFSSFKKTKVMIAEASL